MACITFYDRTHIWYLNCQSRIPSWRISFCPDKVFFSSGYWPVIQIHSMSFCWTIHFSKLIHVRWCRSTISLGFWERPHTWVGNRSNYAALCYCVCRPLWSTNPCIRGRQQMNSNCTSSCARFWFHFSENWSPNQHTGLIVDRMNASLTVANCDGKKIWKKKKLIFDQWQLASAESAYFSADCERRAKHENCENGLVHNTVMPWSVRYTQYMQKNA